MFDKISFWTFIALFQVIAVLSLQEPQNDQMYEDMLQGPNSWMAPYYSATYDSWMEYLRRTQELSNQLHQNWDKRDAFKLFNMGVGMAQQTAAQVQRMAREAMMRNQFGQRFF